ncbi:MAG: hypothetical protein KAW41_02565 [Candidatus Diapherotrites archaeon]|nr:hypothetical protein [Candidatus Diapherotrites archaeon]
MGLLDLFRKKGKQPSVARKLRVRERAAPEEEIIGIGKRPGKKKADLVATAEEQKIIEKLQRLGFKDIKPISRGGASGAIFAAKDGKDTKIFKKTPGASYITTKKEQRGSVIKVGLDKTLKQMAGKKPFPDIVKLVEVDAELEKVPGGEEVMVDRRAGRRLEQEGTITKVKRLSPVPGRDYYVEMKGRDLSLEHWDLLDKGYDETMGNLRETAATAKMAVNQTELLLKLEKPTGARREELEKKIEKGKGKLAQARKYIGYVNALKERAGGDFRRGVLQSAAQQLAQFDTTAKMWGGGATANEVYDKLTVTRAALADKGNVEAMGKGTAAMLEKNIERMFKKAVKNDVDAMKVFRWEIEKWQKGVGKEVKKAGAGRLVRLTKDIYQRDGHLMNVTEASGIFDYDATGKSSLPSEMGRLSASVAFQEKLGELTHLQERYTDAKTDRAREGILKNVRRVGEEMGEITKQATRDIAADYNEHLGLMHDKDFLARLEKNVREGQRVVRKDQIPVRFASLVLPERLVEFREGKREEGALPAQRIAKFVREKKAGWRAKRLEKGKLRVGVREAPQPFGRKMERMGPGRKMERIGPGVKKKARRHIA